MKNTTLCYLEQNGCYLLLHRVKKEHDLNHDKWIGVGGKCEENESPEECARREILEETGLVADTLSYRGIVTFVSDQWEGEYMHLFSSPLFHGVMTDCNEGVLEWVPKETIQSLPIWEGDRIFLKLLDENTPFFSLKLVYKGEHLQKAVLNETTILNN